MNETLIGVIIGGIMVIVGNSVIGWFSKRQTEMQIAARHQEQMTQIEHEKEQLKSDRLVEFRHKWIQPLYASLQQFAEEINRESAQLNRLYYYSSIVNNNEQKQTAIYEFMSAMGGAIGSCKELEKCAVPISDTNLKSLIGKLLTTHEQLVFNPEEGLDDEKYVMAKNTIPIMNDLVANSFKQLEYISCDIGARQ